MERRNLEWERYRDSGRQLVRWRDQNKRESYSDLLDGSPYHPLGDVGGPPP